MYIEVVTPGLLTTVQDMGRIGFASLGVPQSGVMDQYSAKFANMLVGNDANAAVLEVTLLGPTLRFYCNSLIAVGGPGAQLYLNKKEISINEPLYTQKNDVLNLEKIRIGSRIYLAVAGGFQTELVLGSRSMYKGITEQFKLKKGDHLPIKGFTDLRKNTFSSVRFKQKSYETALIKVFPGPEFPLLNAIAKEKIIQKEFSLSKDSNRMAFIFNETIENVLPSILTSPVLPGTIQLTPGGKLIALMRDCQVTGGYPRVLQITEKSMNCLAQKETRDKIRFELVEYPAF